MFIILKIIFLLFLLFFALTGISIAPWFPSRKNDLKRINGLLNLKPGQTFFELGCGDGRVSRFVAKNNPQAKIVGIELFWPIYLFAKLKNIFWRVQNLEIKFGNAFKENLSQVDVVYVFARDKSISSKLKNKFEQELKKDAKVISYVFPMKGWLGQELVNKPIKKDLPIYIYEFKKES